MAMKKNLHAEIEAMRREIDALRAGQTSHHEIGEDKMKRAAGSGIANVVNELRALAHEITASTEDAEKGVASHPVTSVIGALVLGILIGRLTR
jgi:ElaB/YqjD/DUF883 family membrane-anchored ribosome-binding protein